MKIVQGDELPLERGLEHRGGTFHFRRLMEGTPGTIDNFQLSYGVIEGDFYSPRHRHNFEQFRFQLEGELDYSRDGKLKPGMVGYFPEGLAYGPQNPSEGRNVTVVLQFGGASGSGYMSRDESKAGMQALLKLGSFEKGVFRRNDGVPGKKNMDGFQAIWEYVNGRSLEFPKPRYARPVFMDPDAFASLPAGDGVRMKRLGSFTECDTRAALVRISPGARFEADGRAVYFTVSGDGSVAGESLRPLTTLFLERTESATLIAGEQPVEIMRFGLPDLSALKRAGLPGHAAIAAE